jgi:threonine dehydrogenase-like Zn-dependent dehydrogenase
MGNGYSTRAIVLDCDRPRQVALRRFELPAPAAGSLIMGPELSGICGADLHLYDGWFKRGIIVPGHEIVGRVVDISGQVLDAASRPLKVGDRIVPETAIPCRRCRYCRGLGSRYDKLVDYNACESFSFFGSVPISDPQRVIGGWSDYLEVPGNAILHRVDDDEIPLEAIVLLEPLSVAVKTVAKAGVQPGDTVVVQGPGPVGLLSVAMAHAAGATRIILVGPNQARLELGGMLGADLLINSRNEDPVQTVRKATAGELAHRVIDASGAKEAFQQGLDMTGRGGVYVNIGGFRASDEVMFKPDRLKRDKIDIRFSHMGSNAFEPALAILRSRRYPLEELVTHHFPLEEAERGLHVLEQREGNPIKVALTFEGRRS